MHEHTKFELSNLNINCLDYLIQIFIVELKRPECVRTGKATKYALLKILSYQHTEICLLIRCIGFCGE